jgi:hypothetical protein
VGAEFGQSEIQQDGPTVLIDDDVGRFDVPVDDVVVVRLCHSAGKILDNVQGIPEGQALSCDQLGERLTLIPRHHDKRLPFGSFVDLVDGADVGVFYRGRGLGLVYEPHAGRRVSAKMLGNHFDGDNPVKPCVVGFPYLAHTSLAELGENFVMGKRLADHWSLSADISQNMVDWDCNSYPFGGKELLSGLNCPFL